MNLEEILRRRHSVRAFDDRPVRLEDILALGEAARLAPSACNSQTWRFVAVTDRGLIARICDEATRPFIRNEFLRQAPLVIVGCSQLDVVANRLGTAITGIEYFQIDLGIAMEHMVLRATELGLGTCWIGWFRENKVKRILGIPRRIRVSAMLAVGYPRGEETRAHSRKPLSEILFADRWGEPLGPIDSGVFG
ncbi:nitroreductase family protein [Candidatus Sumerlaeota bacterium]|nr:nitroreductase family protein [Candidatus Sumerlaeota bacterium]